jgi:hypothetical protein
MFIFQSIYAEFVTYAGSKKVKFVRGAFRTNDDSIASHLRTNCKGVVTEVKPVVAPAKAEKKSETK